MKSFVLLTLLIGAPNLASATNRGFMPGDAFWHSTLTADGLAAMQASPHPKLGYARPEREAMAFCGYAGYWKIQLPKNSAGLIANLAKVYRHLRGYEHRQLEEFKLANGETVRRETNGFHLFVYNHDFDLETHCIGLRYNENWVKDESSFGPHPRSTRLESFVEDRVAFSTDWRDAELVAPLRTTCPPIPQQEQRQKRGMGSEIITEAVHIDGPIKIVITPRSNLTRYVRSRHGARFFVVTNSRIQQYKSDHGRWVVTDWNPDVNP